MTKKRSTIHALLLSGLALLLCVSMLVGSTYAWLTDRVTSDGNMLETGVLQVALEMWDGRAWVDASKQPILSHDSWEPGYTQVVNLRVVNTGSLSLQWLAMITVEGQLSELADVIGVYVRTDDQFDAVRDYIASVGSADADFDTLAAQDKFSYYTLSQFIGSLPEILNGSLDPNEVFYFGLVLQMGDTVENKYQGMDLGGTFDFNILATQYTTESDDLGNDYDKDAAYPDSIANGTHGVTLLKDVSVTDTTFFRGTDATAAVEVNGSGHTVTMCVTDPSLAVWEDGVFPAAGNVFATANGAQVTVSNLNLRGSMMSALLGYYNTNVTFSTVFNNVSIENAEIVGSAAGFSPAAFIYGNATLNNCRIYGTSTNSGATL